MPRLLTSTNSTFTVVLQLNGYDRIEENLTIVHEQIKTTFNLYSMNVTNTNNLTLNATIYDEYGNTTLGNNRITVKIDGKTNVDSNNNKIYYNITNGKININVPINSCSRGTHQLEVVVGSTAEYTQTRSQNYTFNAKEKLPTITLFSNSSAYKGGCPIRISVNLKSDENLTFNGYAIFKLNGITILNQNNKTLTVNLVNNSASITYTMPRLLISSNSTFTVVLQLRYYGRLEENLTILHDKLVSNLRLNSMNVIDSNTLILNATLYDEYNNTCLGNNRMTVKINGQTNLDSNNKKIYYNITGGKININVPLNNCKNASYKLQVIVGSTAEYTETRSSNYTFNAKEKENTKLIIDTPNKAKNNSTLSIRVYVAYNNDNILKTINDGQVNISINGVLAKTVDVNYAKAIFNYTTPKNTGNYTITATYYNGSQIYDKTTSKNLEITTSTINSTDSQIHGNKDPTKTTITTTNNIPNIIYMTNYVWADENATYTLTKEQYQEVTKKDSYTLYLNNKLSYYVAFKTKDEPNIYHVLRREKWNVIERALNTKLILSNGGAYPETITVNLKGKEYTYTEVRDIQNTSYTCGPTSLSSCTQVLRNYNSEYKLAKAAGSTYSDGTSTSGLKAAAQTYNMSATYYYKSTFDNALNELSKGGCALIFHTWYHYVAIIDISKDKTKVLVSNPSGSYNEGSHGIPTNWLSVSYMKTCFNNYDTSGLIVKLNYNLSTTTKQETNNLYNNMISGWTRANTNERIPNL